MNKLQFEANLELIDQMINPIISSIEENEAEPKKVYQMNLALEEILVNICKYAYSGNKGRIDIAFEISKDPKQLHVVIKDQGKEFNPLAKEDPDLDTPLEDRKIGGLGIFLVKNMVDDIKYQRTNNENVLEIIKKL